MDEDELEMFIEAQDTVLDEVRAELKAGTKTGHWIWFVFPQLASLGQSRMSQLFGLHDLAEATAYLAHPELRTRLIEVSNLMLTHEGKAADAILGSIDAQKLKSSMTLFAAVPGAPEEFRRVLDVFFDGQTCGRTLSEIAS